MLRQTKPMQLITARENLLNENSKCSGYDIDNSKRLGKLNSAGKGRILFCC